MKNKLKNPDRIQDTVIALLCVITLFLLCKTLSSSLLADNIEKVFTHDGSATTAFSSGSFDGKIGSEPQYIVVNSKVGSHYSSKYSDAKEELISKFSAMLGEALGSAKNPKAISEEEWNSSLKTEGVLFDYVFPQSLGFVSLTLGTSCSAEIADVIARRMLLRIDGSSLYLCYIDESSGNYYRCETAPSAVSLSAKIAECPIGDAQFAFEYDDQFKNIDPYFIFTNENIVIQDITAKNPIASTSIAGSFLSYFGVNENTSSQLTESNGSKVYVENSKTLRIEPDGKIVFSAGEKNGIPIKYTGNAPSLTDIILASGKIVGNVFSYFGIDATLGVTDITGGTDPSSCTVSFGQFINGVPVSVSNSPSIAVFRIENGYIVRIDLLIRSYTTSPLDTSSPLPEKQTAAIIKQEGGEPVLMYIDDRGTIPTVSWILKS